MHAELKMAINKLLTSRHEKYAPSATFAKCNVLTMSCAKHCAQHAVMEMSVQWVSFLHQAIILIKKISMADNRTLHSSQLWLEQKQIAVGCVAPYHVVDPWLYLNPDS